MGWLAGYGQADVTPPAGVELSGYGFYRQRRAVGVHDPLMVRAAAIRAGDPDQKIILISCDLFGFDSGRAESLAQRITRDLPVRREEILISCTHTHTGPATMDIPSLGLCDPRYLAGLEDKIAAAASSAWADLQEARLFFGVEKIEPIGFNRRYGNFDGIDPTLSLLRCQRADGEIYLINYACHAVVMGPAAQVSADFPGAAVKALEKRGIKGIFFQGFCGDIDPVTNLNRWGEGQQEDWSLYGEILAGRAVKAGKYAQEIASENIRTNLMRVDLPLQVPSSWEDGQKKQRQLWGEKFAGQFPGAWEFYQEWESKAKAAWQQRLGDPWLRKQPLALWEIGDLKIVALPGEADCGYGIKLRQKWGKLLSIGYAGGNAGYLPGAAIYEQTGDYTCYCAPMFYEPLFPFDKDIEKIILNQLMIK